MKTKHIILASLLCLQTQVSLFGAYDSLEEETQERINAMILFDYEVINLPQGKSIDLLGVHYLQQLNHWLYFGIGVHAPLVQGDYGGFMTLDATLHAQQKIYDDFFVNAGVSLGGGGGGSSVSQSRELSGTGGFMKSYIGLGYEFDNKVSIGANYAHFKFENSQINDAQLNLFVQAPLEYTVGAYSNAGNSFSGISEYLSSQESILTLELNNLIQIEPTAETKDTINNIALQYSHFLNENYYLFLEAEIGYKGLPLYNQFTHGIGRKTPLLDDLNLYTQIGIGSGGYSPANIDTGSGLLIYPKASLEYLFEDNLGVALSGGYLYAPTGTSKSYTAGLALNYHLSNHKNTNHKKSRTYKGFRFSIFPQAEVGVKNNDKKHQDIQLLTTQLDSLINHYWYVAAQISVAYNEFAGYPGYGEALVGIGLQNRYKKSDKFQNFAQLLLGGNIHGVIFKPSVGTNYSINEKYALYAQLGYVSSINDANLYTKEKSLSAYSVGAGVTYRFSLY